MSRSILIHDGQIARDVGLVYICSGYLVEQGKLLLVHHNRFDKWVPPGGHIEPGESFAGTAVREFKEETGLLVETISSQPAIHPADENATPEPVPFYVDIEREGFATPAFGCPAMPAARRIGKTSLVLTMDDTDVSVKPQPPS